MKIELLHNTPLFVCAKAIRKCWASEDKSDTEWLSQEEREDGGIFFREPFDDYLDCLKTSLYNVDYTTGKKDKELINRVGNKNKHKSTLEHLVYTFDIDGISRACLQEVARHRMASYSVKSTRYTLKELKEEQPFVDYIDKEEGFVRVSTDEQIARASKFVVLSKIRAVNCTLCRAIDDVRIALNVNVSNDYVKYMLPEAYKTSLVMTINARSLQNFLELRSSKAALWEIQELAKALFEALPSEHKYLFEDYMND